ncbi:hypothetical protein [Streptomyces griseoflavus]|uniref:hypothetical protein n=1 Tax=Streptomyces griseoflavus TaxID=35619 RepID=UPI003F4CF17E
MAASPAARRPACPPSAVRSAVFPAGVGSAPPRAAFADGASSAEAFPAAGFPVAVFFDAGAAFLPVFFPEGVRAGAFAVRSPDASAEGGRPRTAAPPAGGIFSGVGSAAGSACSVPRAVFFATMAATPSHM